MSDPGRDAFGRLIVDPGALDFAGRVDCLRRLAGELQAGRTREAKWLGSVLLAWLHEGGDLRDHLGLRPPRGSRATPQALVRDDEMRRLMARLCVEVGGATRASRVLRDLEPVPAGAQALVRRLRELGAPSSLRSIARHRSAPRHGR